MPKWVALVALLLVGGGVGAQIPPVQFNPEAEEPSVLPDGAGRDETFYACVACHSTALIRRTGASRARWEELMDWMAERHGMPDLGADRTVIVNYLAQHFGPRSAPGQRPNPFLRQSPG